MTITPLTIKRPQVQRNIVAKARRSLSVIKQFLLAASRFASNRPSLLVAPRTVPIQKYKLISALFPEPSVELFADHIYSCWIEPRSESNPTKYQLPARPPDKGLLSEIALLVKPHGDRQTRDRFTVSIQTSSLKFGTDLGIGCHLVLGDVQLLEYCDDFLSVMEGTPACELVTRIPVTFRGSAVSLEILLSALRIVYEGEKKKRPAVSQILEPLDFLAERNMNCPIVLLGQVVMHRVIEEALMEAERGGRSESFEDSIRRLRVVHESSGTVRELILQIIDQFAVNPNSATAGSAFSMYSLRGSLIAEQWGLIGGSVFHKLAKYALRYRNLSETEIIDRFSGQMASIV